MALVYRINGKEVSEKQFRSRKCRIVPGVSPQIRHGAGWPMYSEALAVSPEDIPAAMAEDKRLGIRHTNYLPDGRVELVSPAHRKEYAERYGMYDRNGGYGDPQQGKCRE